MLKSITYLIIFAFTVIGLVQTAKGFAAWLLKPKSGYKKFTVIPLCGHTEDAELILRFEHQFKAAHDCEIIVADCGMDSETAEICRLLIKQGQIDRVITADQFNLIENAVSCGQPR